MAASYCEQCGSALGPGDVFCENCGARVAPATPMPRAARMATVRVTTSGGIAAPDGAQTNLGAGSLFCPNCGASIEPTDAFCVACGVRIPAAPVAAPASAPAVAAAGPMFVPTSVPAVAPAGLGLQTPAAVAPSSTPPEDDEDDDDPTVLTKLVTITQEEARMGCRKTVALGEGRSVEVDVPAGTNPGTKIDVAGYGLEDTRTGMRGPLRVSFYIVR